MNYSTAVFLINAEVRAILGTYEVDDENKKAPRTLFKTLDKTVRVGDFVIVPTETRHKMTVCKVVETDVDVDFDSVACINWLIGKIDRALYELTLSQEADAIAVIKSAEKTKKRNELRDAMLADSSEALRALPITIVATPAIPDSQS